MLIRYHGGEHKLWSVVRIPSPDDEDRRQPHRELMAVKNERTEHSNRIKGLLANLGLDIVVDEQLSKRLGLLRQWDGQPVPTELTARILREFDAGRWRTARPATWRTPSGARSATTRRPTSRSSGC